MIERINHNKAVIFRTPEGRIIWSPYPENDESFIREREKKGDIVLQITTVEKAVKQVNQRNEDDLFSISRINLAK